MYRLIHRMLRLSTAARYWTRRRFTPAGQFAIGCMIAAALLGLDTDLTLTYQLFTLTGVMLALAYLVSLFFRGRFEAMRILPPFVTAGETFSYKTRIKNRGHRSQRDLELLERLADPRPTLEEFRTGAPPWWRGLYPHWRRLVGRREAGEIRPQMLATLPPGKPVEIPGQGVAHRRGYLEFAALTIARRDPLGLCRALMDVPERRTLLVVPKRYDLPELELPGARIYQHGGVTLAASKGDSEEFVGLRDYRPGDPLKRVHWKSFARTRKPIVKEYQDEYFERHALVLDTFAGTAQEQVFEEAVSLAASFVCTLERQENLLDLLFVGDRTYSFTAGTGQLHTDSMLEILAGVQACPDGRIDDLRRAVLERRSMLSGCILVLVGWDRARRELVEELTASGLPLKTFLVVGDEGPEIPAETHLKVLHVGRIEQDLAQS